MSIMTNVYENAVLGLANGTTASIAGWTPFVGLLTAITDAETGSVTEASYTGYLGRRSVGLGAISQDGSSNAQASNAALIQFGTNTGASVNVVGVGIYTAASGGELRYVIPITTAAVATNAQPEFAAGQLSIRHN
jgi:hypothetical protein